MTVVIEDERAIAELERLAAGLNVPAGEVVRRVLLEKARVESQQAKAWTTREHFDAAVRDLQTWAAAQHNPYDTRTPDEIIGYNESGLFD